MTEIDFNEERHEYRVNGVLLPSVTQCIDRLNDYSGIPAAILAHAADRGTRVHKATELYDLGTLDWASVDDEVMPYLEAWIRFRHDTGFEPLTIEERLYSEKRQVCGTLDRTGTFSRLPKMPAESVALLDIKSTAEMMPGTGPQTAAYLDMKNEGQRKKIRRRFGVQLGKDGRYVLHEYKDHEADLAVFLACLTIRKFELRRNAK